MSRRAIDISKAIEAPAGPFKCRCIVYTTDGKAHPTKWIWQKPWDQLGPDDFGAARRADKCAQRMIERMNLANVKTISTQYCHPKPKEKAR